MARIRGFLWDDDNVAHIARHGVDPEDVEDALTGNPLVFRGPDGRYLAYGKTTTGRLLFVVYAPRRGGRIRVLTARNMTDREKRLYRSRRKDE